jgi:hypothetical protein
MGLSAITSLDHLAATLVVEIMRRDGQARGSFVLSYS